MAAQARNVLQIHHNSKAPCLQAGACGSVQPQASCFWLGSSFCAHAIAAGFGFSRSESVHVEDCISHRALHIYLEYVGNFSPDLQDGMGVQQPWGRVHLGRREMSAGRRCSCEPPLTRPPSFPAGYWGIRKQQRLQATLCLLQYAAELPNPVLSPCGSKFVWPAQGWTAALPLSWPSTCFC